MSTSDEDERAKRIKELEETVHRLEVERIEELEETVRRLEVENAQLRTLDERKKNTEEHEEDAYGDKIDKALPALDHLSRDQIERYSRQLLLQDGFGVQGQLKLLSSSVLIVGAGGIGSTVILYLAACGVGRLTIVDFDEVDISNLHRQVIHKSKDVGMNKAESACRAVKDLNPTIECCVIRIPLSYDNALDLVSKHSCVVDASDNPKTRLLVNDSCVLANIPLVSGSAVGTEGQLTVYNFNGGGCYRCLYPKPSASEGSKTCADNGVLGPVPGLIGVLQALETMKVITGVGVTMHDRLVMYDSLRCSFMSIKKPPKQSKCPVCSLAPTIRSMDDSRELSLSARGPSCSLDGGKSVSLNERPAIAEELEVSIVEYNRIRTEEIPHVLLDVRVKEQFDLCSLDGAVNIPLEKLEDQLERVEELSNGIKPVFCMCRRGFFSVLATHMLNDAAAIRPRIHSVKNIEGGLTAWQIDVDHMFPKY